MSILKKLGLVADVGTAEGYSAAELAAMSSSYATTDAVVDTSGLQTAEQIYDANELGDRTRSIFRVEEIKAPLQSLMAGPALKQAVTSMVTVNGLTVEELVQDGHNRIAVLQSVKDGFQTETDNIIAAHQAEIANLQAQIEQLNQEISDRVVLNAEQGKTVDTEVSKIEAIDQFIS